jgi:hypothetical protein
MHFKSMLLYMSQAKGISRLERESFVLFKKTPMLAMHK